MPYLRKGKFDGQTDDIGDCQQGQGPQKTKPKASENGALRTERCRYRFVMLIADIPHPEKHGRHQGDDHEDHGTFQVDGVTHVAAFRSHPVRCECESVECLVSAFQPSPFSLGFVAFKPLRQLGELFTFHFQLFTHPITSFLKVSNPSLMICWISVFEVSINSQSAKSSGSTS